jgi:hypothetical protein
MKDPTPLRVAMWSGPRNISTALMRSFGNRPDTLVCDEPLYAHYLAETRAPHPGAAQVIAHHERDWRKVVAWLTGPVPNEKRVFYQKHMTHHLLDGIERGWVAQLSNAFLIRDPREMLLSLAKVTPHPGVHDTGLPQQVELLEAETRRTGRAPPVLDAQDVLADPRAVLGELCERLGLEFTDAMLRWEPGRRATDGIWAEHWYAEVERSTGFQPWQPRPGELTGELARVHEQCLPYYRALHARRITA